MESTASSNTVFPAGECTVGKNGRTGMADRVDPLPELSVWKLTLNGQPSQFIKSLAVPTETSMVIGFSATIDGSLSDWAFQEMQGQRRIFAGNLITLDTSLRAVYCDAWDSAFIQQVEMS